MLKIEKSIHLTGKSTIDMEENGETMTKQIAFMSADIPDSGECMINKSIQDRELFNENKNDVLNDFAEFEKHVYSIS